MIDIGLNYIADIVGQTGFLNTPWLVHSILTLLTLIILTRDVNKWKQLALPITMLWHIIGIQPSYLMYLGAGIVFIIDNLSINIIGKTIRTITRKKKQESNEMTKKKLLNLDKKTISKFHDQLVDAYKNKKK